jgi:hypothetical protein
MYRGSNRIDKTLVGIGSEVDGDPGLGRNGTGDLDVEHHLSVGPVGITCRSIGPTIH